MEPDVLCIATSPLEVLFEFKGSKRKISMQTSDSLQSAIQREVGELGHDIFVAPINGVPAPSCSTKSTFILQKWSAKFETFVDVTDERDFHDGDRFTLVPDYDSICSETNSLTSSSKGLTERMSGICKKLQKPSSSHREALRKLFPSSSSKSIKRSSSDLSFDPTEDCAFSSQQKKKKGARQKTTTINVVVVDDSKSGVPRGSYKKRLIREGYWIKMDLHRNMTSASVKQAIQKAIMPLNITSYSILECVGQQLTAGGSQLPNGNEVIDAVTKRKGNVLYLCRRESTDNCEQKEDNHKEMKAEAVTLLSESEDDETQLPDIQVTRQVIYQRSDEGTCDQLRPDNESGNEETSQAAKQHEQQQQQVESLKETLKTKFETRILDGGVTIGFRHKHMPKLEYCFMPTEPTKVLYEFLFASGVGTSFSLFHAMPRSSVPLSSTTTIADVGITHPCTLMIEQGGQDVITSLQIPSADVMLPQEDRAVSDTTKSLSLATEERMHFLSTLPMKMGVTHQIDRQSLYQDVLKLFNNVQVLRECPLSISFKGENAIDDGGVCRDMLAGFWEEAYKQMFDGGTLLTPVIHAQTDISALPVLGIILSHGYLLQGFLPIRIAFPTLTGLLSGPAAVVPDDILLHTIANSVSAVEAALIKDCLKVSSTSSFTRDMLNRLVTFFSRFDSREMPHPQNIRKQLVQIAKFEFVTKPLAAISLIHSGIPREEHLFWKSKSVLQLYSLYCSLAASPSKVLELLNEPEYANQAEVQVFRYLEQYIGNMNAEEVQVFLRYVTGSSVLTKSITVTFNNLSGLARRPIAHTCSCTLELSRDYTTYGEFIHEFQSILRDTEYSWCMDAI